MTEHTAYPLQWPAGKPATAPMNRQTQGRFRASFAEARDECYLEIERLGGTDVVVSTNVRLKRDGKPEAVAWGKAIAGSPGVAVYFKRKGKALCFACDCWAHVQDNMHAVVLTIAALRGIARWGTGDMMEAAFTGFMALPAPGETSNGSPWATLGIAMNATKEQVTDAYRALAKKFHPDIPGTGDADRFNRIKQAYDLIVQNHQ